MTRKLVTLLIFAILLYGGYRLFRHGFSLHQAARALDNDSISVEVLERIAKKQPAALFTVKVSTQNNLVFLQGRVAGEKEKKELENLSRETEGVKGVRSQLIVDSTLRTPEQFKKDLKIIAQIKEKLIREEGLRGLNIHVDVNEGNVTLTGEVPSQEQSILAKQMAETIPGVRKVKNQIRIR